MRNKVKIVLIIAVLSLSILAMSLSGCAISVVKKNISMIVGQQIAIADLVDKEYGSISSKNEAIANIEVDYIVAVSLGTTKIVTFPKFIGTGFEITINVVEEDVIIAKNDQTDDYFKKLTLGTIIEPPVTCSPIDKTPGKLDFQYEVGMFSEDAKGNLRAVGRGSGTIKFKSEQMTEWLESPYVIDFESQEIEDIISSQLFKLSTSPIYDYELATIANLSGYYNGTAIDFKTGMDLYALKHVKVIDIVRSTSVINMDFFSDEHTTQQIAIGKDVKVNKINIINKQALTSITIGCVGTLREPIVINDCPMLKTVLLDGIVGTDKTDDLSATQAELFISGDSITDIILLSRSMQDEITVNISDIMAMRNLKLALSESANLNISNVTFSSISICNSENKIANAIFDNISVADWQRWSYDNLSIKNCTISEGMDSVQSNILNMSNVALLGKIASKQIKELYIDNLNQLTDIEVVGTLESIVIRNVASLNSIDISNNIIKSADFGNMQIHDLNIRYCRLPNINFLSSCRIGKLNVTATEAVNSVDFNTMLNILEANGTIVTRSGGGDSTLENYTFNSFAEFSPSEMPYYARTVIFNLSADESNREVSIPAAITNVFINSSTNYTLNNCTITMNQSASAVKLILQNVSVINNKSFIMSDNRTLILEFIGSNNIKERGYTSGSYYLISASDLSIVAEQAATVSISGCNGLAGNYGSGGTNASGSGSGGAGKAGANGEAGRTPIRCNYFSLSVAVSNRIEIIGGNGGAGGTGGIGGYGGYGSIGGFGGGGNGGTGGNGRSGALPIIVANSASISNEGTIQIRSGTAGVGGRGGNGGAAYESWFHRAVPGSGGSGGTGGESVNRSAIENALNCSQSSDISKIEIYAGRAGMNGWSGSSGGIVIR